MAKRIAATQARQEFSDIVNRAAYGGERIVLHRRKKPVAAIVPIEDLELLERIEDELDIKSAQKALKEKGLVRWTKIKKELGL
jgi:prevent-host-death family protein